MSEADTLPTNRDEAWRYADAAALAALTPAQLASWHEGVLAAGETRVQDFIFGEGQPGLHRIRLKLGAGARAEIFAVVCASQYTRLEVEIQLGKGAHFELGGVTIGGGDAVREIVTRTLHAHPNGTSNQVVRSVHWGQATGNFLGNIDVARDAQKTDAAQDFKGLVLEKGASVNAVPQLEIFADDVKCAHGAAIGQLDEMARYYMASRGIDPASAKALLVRAFLGDAFAAYADLAGQERLMDAALAALGDAV